MNARSVPLVVYQVLLCCSFLVGEHYLHPVLTKEVLPSSSSRGGGYPHLGYTPTQVRSKVRMGVLPIQVRFQIWTGEIWTGGTPGYTPIQVRSQVWTGGTQGYTPTQVRSQVKMRSTPPGTEQQWSTSTWRAE